MKGVKIVLNILVLAAFSLPIIAAANAPAPTCQNGKAIVGGQAQDDKNGVYCSLTTIPGLTDINQPVDPVKIIRNAYGVSIGIAAVLAIGVIIWAGVEYATVESITGHSDAKKRWEGALWGLALLLGSYLILRTINLDLVNVNLDLGAPSVGEKVDANAMQNALDNYSASVSKLTSTKAEIATLNQQRNQKQTALDKLIGEGKEDSPEAQALQEQIQSIREELMGLEKDKETQQSAVDAARTQVQTATADATKAVCYTASNRTSSRESCFPTLKACQTAQASETSPSKTACQELSPLEAQTKYQYCASYTYIAGSQGRTNVISATKSICSITAVGCQTQKDSLMKANVGKKATDQGFVQSVGSCTPELKSS